LGPVVVGVDGSECANAALKIAAKEARLHGARLHVVSAWEVPPAIYGVGGFTPQLDEATIQAFREAAELIVREAVARVHGLDPDLDCNGEAIEGQPASAILGAGEEASMIIVGNRGLGGFSSLLLGSVSQQVAHHANCPVLVVHEPDSGSNE
jgi:nucleotide-binding universal stress UspA family protein